MFNTREKHLIKHANSQVEVVPPLVCVNTQLSREQGHPSPAVQLNYTSWIHHLGQWPAGHRVQDQSCGAHGAWPNECIGHEVSRVSTDLTTETSWFGKEPVHRFKYVQSLILDPVINNIQLFMWMQRHWSLRYWNTRMDRRSEQRPENWAVSLKVAEPTVCPPAIDARCCHAAWLHAMPLSAHCCGEAQQRCGNTIHARW